MFGILICLLVYLFYAVYIQIYANACSVAHKVPSMVAIYIIYTMCILSAIFSKYICSKLLEELCNIAVFLVTIYINK